MKNICNLILIVSLFGFSSAAYAQKTWEQALPLLQKHQRTAAENQQVLSLFRSTSDPYTIFAAGASLVKNPPAKVQEPALFSILMKNEDPLKKTFAAVIITAMGQTHEELLPVLQEARQSQDAVLRAYAATAEVIIAPSKTELADEVVLLYSYDPTFAKRAMHLLAEDTSEQIKYLKKAGKSKEMAVRGAAAAWLGTFHTQQAANELLKLAKSEKDANASAQIATALAKNREYTLSEVTKELKRSYKSPQSATYALALGFMTGNAAEIVRQGLLNENKNIRINSARAAAYMAGVLSNPDAFAYTSDRTFDISLLKGMIPQLNVLAADPKAPEAPYAANALTQIEKLMD